MKRTQIKQYQRVLPCTARSSSQERRKRCRMLRICRLKDRPGRLQVNPLAEDDEGKLIAADAKLGFDDNAAFRQAEIFALRDASQEDPRCPRTPSPHAAGDHAPACHLCVFRHMVLLYGVLSRHAVGP